MPLALRPTRRRAATLACVVLLIQAGASALGAPPAAASDPASPASAAAARGLVDGSPDCGAAITQAAMNACARDAFEAASAVYAQRYAALHRSLPTEQRERLRRMQGAWLQYRTAACRFESGPSAGGSVQALIYWQCAARMTRDRAAELARLAVCVEGDLSCTPAPR